MKLQSIVLTAFAFLMIVPTGQSAMGNTVNSLEATPPAFLTDVTIPSTVAIRHVYGTMFIQGGTVAISEGSIRLCNGGVLQYSQSPATINTFFQFSVSLSGGSCYEFDRVQAAGGAVSIHEYSYVDVIYEEFEGQRNANLTWESQTHANNTWESRVHANQTWCGPGYDTGFTYIRECVGDDWFNDTFRRNANFTNMTIQNAFGGNFTGNFFLLDVYGMIETAFDPYLPLVIFGGLLTFFMYRNAILPSMATFLVLGNSALPVPIWGMSANILMLGVALMAHAIILRWPVTFLKWARGSAE